MWSRPLTPAAGASLTGACSGSATNGCVWALIEASWSAIQFSGYFGAIYCNAHARGKNKNVTITMVAHRMAKIIWLLLMQKRPYTETLPDRSEEGLTVTPCCKALSHASQR